MCDHGQPCVEVGVVGEGDLDDPMHTFRGVRADLLRRICLIERDAMRDSRPDLRGDTGDAQARTEIVADPRRQPHGLLVRHHCQLRGGAERAVRLRAVGPHTLTNATRVPPSPRRR